MLRCAILAIVLAMPVTGVAAPADLATYPTAEGREALVCAWLFTATADRLQADGVIDPARRDVAFRWSERVLNRYVGGSADEQRAALADIAAGRDTGQLVEDFAAQGNGCLDRFPI